MNTSFRLLRLVLNHKMITCFIVVVLMSIIKEFTPFYFHYYGLENIRFYSALIFCVLLVFGGNLINS